MKQFSDEWRKALKVMAGDLNGATAVEYAIIAAATALGIVAVLPSISTSLVTIFTNVSSGF